MLYMNFKHDINSMVITTLSNFLTEFYACFNEK
jgi:hypothetical protein